MHMHCRIALPPVKQTSPAQRCYVWHSLDNKHTRPPSWAPCLLVTAIYDACIAHCGHPVLQENTDHA